MSLFKKTPLVPLALLLTLLQGDGFTGTIGDLLNECDSVEDSALALTVDHEHGFCGLPSVSYEDGSILLARIRLELYEAEVRREELAAHIAETVRLAAERDRGILRSGGMLLSLDTPHTRGALDAQIEHDLLACRGIYSNAEVDVVDTVA